ncbi:E3 ubiquitin-protein ligase APD3-like [Vicia villosa]|uniref:E3 ubiquitin-protein ligase APD3-like n=1 Tax=Vicia villosa TaxID=3911 RepID=UPI00273B5336|nr:E3 ubiquitin-protein ligase APD3-like [Vicia villosa]
MSMHRSLWLPLSNPTTYQSLMDPIPITPTHSHSIGWQETWPFILATLSIYFCVSVSLLYGFYGDSRLILGPSSSRLVKVTSVFVEQIQVSNEYTTSKNHVHLYAFNEKPELSSQTNWTTSKFLSLQAYSRKGISLWLNKGSTIFLRWEADAGSLNQLKGIVIKGERRYEKLKPKQTTFPEAMPMVVKESHNGKEAEYIVEEDDRYHIAVLNMNPRNIILTMNVNVSAKIYDTTKSTNMCSTWNGSCKLDTFFPITYYVILTSSKNGNNDDDDAWFVEVSFLARVFSYVILLGMFMIVIFLILKCLGSGDGDNDNVVAAQEVTETEPLVHAQTNIVTYGTNKFHEKEDSESESDALSSSSEELYNEKLCIICYDEQRNCFFVPCGHCATCYDCAQRIMNGESKVCPVCRRLLHRVRRLFNS